MIFTDNILPFPLPYESSISSNDVSSLDKETILIELFSFKEFYFKLIELNQNLLFNRNWKCNMIMRKLSFKFSNCVHIINFMIEFLTIKNKIYVIENKEKLLYFYLKNGRERAITVRNHRVGCIT